MRAALRRQARNLESSAHRSNVVDVKTLPIAQRNPQLLEKLLKQTPVANHMSQLAETCTITSSAMRASLMNISAEEVLRRHESFEQILKLTNKSEIVPLLDSVGHAHRLTNDTRRKLYQALSVTIAQNQNDYSFDELALVSSAFLRMNRMKPQFLMSIAPALEEKLSTAPIVAAVEMLSCFHACNLYPTNLMNKLLSRTLTFANALHFAHVSKAFQVASQYSSCNASFDLKPWLQAVEQKLQNASSTSDMHSIDLCRVVDAVASQSRQPSQQSVVSASLKNALLQSIVCVTSSEQAPAFALRSFTEFACCENQSELLKEHLASELVRAVPQFNVTDASRVIQALATLTEVEQSFLNEFYAHCVTQLPRWIENADYIDVAALAVACHAKKGVLASSAFVTDALTSRLRDSLAVTWHPDVVKAVNHCQARNPRFQV